MKSLDSLIEEAESSVAAIRKAENEKRQVTDLMFSDIKQILVQFDKKYTFQNNCFLEIGRDEATFFNRCGNQSVRLSIVKALKSHIFELIASWQVEIKTYSDVNCEQALKDFFTNIFLIGNPVKKT